MVYDTQQCIDSEYISCLKSKTLILNVCIQYVLKEAEAKYYIPLI
jgi:hypothetical protein